MQQPDLDLLALFEAVARTRSFSAAARELGMPKSSVSRGIARLEASLGAQLLFRTTRQVALSAVGTALVDEVTPLLAGLRRAVSGVPGREELPSGELRVTAPADVGALFLAEAVTRYTARYPAVQVELHLSGRVVDLVAEGFDLALRVGERLRDSSLVARRAAPVVLQLYASPLYLARRGVPRGEADLAGHDGVLFRSGPQKLRIPRAGGADALHPRIVCDDLLFARDALRAGAGIGLLPTFVAAPEVAAGTLVRVVPGHERIAGYLHLVTPGGRHLSRKVTAFRDLTLELLRGAASHGAGGR